MRANQDSVAVDQIDWKYVFPAFQILHAARAAWGLQMLVPALAAILISQLAIRSFPDLPPLKSAGGHEQPEIRDLTSTEAASDAFCRWSLPVPASQLFLDCGSILRDGSLMNGRYWLRITANLAVLSFFGGAVCCSAARYFCRQQRIGVQAAVRMASGMLVPLFVSAGLSLSLIFGPWLLLRLAQRLAVWTGILQLVPSWVSAVLWLAALLIVLLVIVVGAGWLLGICAIATDRCSGTDALSRGINYVLSHPLRSVLYGLLVLLTVIGGSVTLQVISDYATELIISRSPADNQILMQHLTVDLALSTEMRSVMRTFPELIIEAYRFSIFFGGLTIAYVLLRKHEDSVDLSELQNSD